MFFHFCCTRAWSWKNFIFLEKKNIFLFQEKWSFSNFKLLYRKNEKTLENAMAQKKRISLYFYAHFELGPYDKNWNVWTFFHEKIPIFVKKYIFFQEKWSFFQLQALVQQKWKNIRTCYMAQKKRMGLYFYAHFELSPYNKNWNVWTFFMKQYSKPALEGTLECHFSRCFFFCFFG